LQFLNVNHLKAGDFPFLIINTWNLNKNTINFRYCFPIKLKDSMPFHKDIKFDVLKPQKALKAIYNGNYKTSDRGWFTLHEYAKRHHVAIKNKPIEFFYHNPHNGGNELDWKTEIFMPLKE
jgi:effector-binding domain-containing protein